MRKISTKNMWQSCLKQTCLKVLAVGVLIGAGAGASFAQTTLQEALTEAYNGSDQIRAARNGTRQADGAIANARAPYLPKLNIGLSKTFTYPQTSDPRAPSSIAGQAGLSFEQLIWDGGRTPAHVDATIAESEAARQNQALAEQGVLLSAIRAFFNVQSNLQEIEINRNNVRVLTEQARATQNRFSVGAVTRTDVSQAKARLAAATGRLERSKGTLESSMAQYIAVMGSAPTDLIMPDSMPDIPPNAAEAEALAMQTHPSILAARFTVRAAEFQLRRAYRTIVPEFKGSVAYGISRNTNIRAATGQNPPDALVGTLNVSVPFYNGGILISAKRSANAGVSRAMATLSDQIRQRRQLVYSAYANLRATKAEKAAARSQIESAKLAFEGITQEARLGTRTTLDVLNTEQEFLSARSNLIRAEREEFVATYTILAEIGLLNPEYLGLDVEDTKVATPYTAERKTKVTESKLGKRRLEVLKKMESR